RSPVRFVAAKDSDLDVSPEGLAGKIIGVQAGTVYEPWLSDNYTESEIRAYPTVDEHNADLLSGRIDLIIGDALALLGGFLETDDGEAYEFVGPDLTDPALVGDGIGIAVRQGEDELREALNTAIATIRENGTYAEINARYFAIDIYGE
ncbi:MAG: transporter substrate-binding domain-containing protein, partial [Pseudomonadota bacterium]